MEYEPLATVTANTQKDGYRLAFYIDRFQPRLLVSVLGLSMHQRVTSAIELGRSSDSQLEDQLGIHPRFPIVAPSRCT